MRRRSVLSSATLVSNMSLPEVADAASYQDVPA
jgi:hypothetical protein